MAFNPSATIASVTPTTFVPGDNIDIDVRYSASNPDATWSTCIVVTRQDNGAVYKKIHSMLAASDSNIVEPIVCGVMPSGAIQLKVQILGNDDYWAGLP